MGFESHPLRQQRNYIAGKPVKLRTHSGRPYFYPHNEAPGDEGCDDGAQPPTPKWTGRRSPGRLPTGTRSKHRLRKTQPSQPSCRTSPSNHRTTGYSRVMVPRTMLFDHSSPLLFHFLFLPLQLREYAVQNLDHFRLVLLRQVDQHAQTVALL
jgi:hypothetical protein